MLVLELQSQIVRSWVDSMLAAVELSAAAMSTAVPIAKPASHISPISKPGAGSRTATGSSWYRAPYRSPFDPMFWLEPTAAVAVDRPIIGDVMPGFYQPWAAGAAWTWNPMAVAPWMQVDWLTGRDGVYGIGGFNRDCATSAAELATSALFSAYRSAGGHAVGQIAQVEEPRSGSDGGGDALKAGITAPLQAWGDLASIQRDMALDWMRLWSRWR